MSKENGRLIMDLGRSIVIKGDLIASEDLTLYGQMEGSVTLQGGHTLTIGRYADIKAEIDAKAVVIQGTVTGNVTAARESRDPDDGIRRRRRQLSAPRHRRRRFDSRQGPRPTRLATTGPCNHPHALSMVTAKLCARRYPFIDPSGREGSSSCTRWLSPWNAEGSVKRCGATRGGRSRF